MDRINIVEPNGVERTRPIPFQGLTIGRGNDNNIVLGYEEVSRYHAQISFNGQHYEVVDLDSANGTFLGNTRLQPNAPAAWNPNAPLRIGGVTMRLLATQRSTAAVPMAEARDSTETVYWSAAAAETKGNANRTLLLVGLVVTGLVLCAGAGVAAYFLF